MLVYDADSGEVIEVSRQEAAAGVARYARSLRPGTAACGEWERKALALLASESASSSARKAATD